MTLQNLKQKAIDNDKIVEETITSDKEETCAVTAGIIDPERYFKSKYKILWILKELVDEFDEEGNRTAVEGA